MSQRKRKPLQYDHSIFVHFEDRKHLVAVFFRRGALRRTLARLRIANRARVYSTSDASVV